MKKSMSVTVGLILTAGIGVACAAGEEAEQPELVIADNQQICVTVVDNGTNLERVPNDKCKHQPEDNGGGASFQCIWCWYYLGKVFGTPPAVGQRIPVASGGSFGKPASGTTAIPPEAGGFGMTTGTVPG